MNPDIANIVEAELGKLAGVEDDVKVATKDTSLNFFELFVDTGRKLYDMAFGKPLPADELLGAGDYPLDNPGSYRHASPDAETDGQHAEDAEASAYDEGPAGEIQGRQGDAEPRGDVPL